MKRRYDGVGNRRKDRSQKGDIAPQKGDFAAQKQDIAAQKTDILAAAAAAVREPEPVIVLEEALEKGKRQKSEDRVRNVVKAGLLIFPVT